MFEQLAFALKTELALKFLRTGGATAPRLCLWLNTNHLRNFLSDNLSQDKSCKEIIYQ